MMAVMKEGVIYEVRWDDNAQAFSQKAVKSLNQVTKATKETGDQNDKTKHKTKELGDVFDQFGAKLSGTVRRYMTYTGAVMLANKAMAYVNNYVAYADRIDDLRIKTGATAEQLTGLGFAAKLANAQFGSTQDAADAIGKSFGFLAVNMQTAREGSQQMKDTLARLGIGERELNDPTLGIYDLFLKVADAAKNSTDKVQLLADAKRTLGRSGADLIPLLIQGADAIKNETEQARIFGAVLSNETVVAASVFGDELDRIKQTIATGLISESAMTGLAGFTLLLTDAVKGLDKISTALKIIPEPPEWLSAYLRLVAKGPLLGPLAEGYGYLAGKSQERYAEQAARTARDEMRKADAAIMAQDSMARLAKKSAATGGGGAATPTGPTGTALPYEYGASMDYARARQNELEAEIAAAQALVGMYESVDFPMMAERSRAIAEEAERAHQAYVRQQITLSAIGNYLDGIADTVTGSLSDGIAGSLVDGTYEWRDAMRAVLKQMIAMTARMLINLALQQAINAASGGGGVTSFAAGLVGGLFKHGGGEIYHSGGYIPTMHTGGLRPDERYIRAQTGEFVMQRSAVNAIGVENLAAMNRTGSAPTNFTFAPTINVTSNGGNARQIGRELGEGMWSYFEREMKRGRRLPA